MSDTTFRLTIYGLIIGVVLIVVLLAILMTDKK
jgi:hypothetical protein